MARKADHLHEYRKQKLGNKGYLIFKCTVPGCNHYVPLNLALGRLCKCNRCGEAMVIGQYAKRLARPHCDDCIKGKDSDDINKLREMFV